MKREIKSQTYSFLIGKAGSELKYINSRKLSLQWKLWNIINKSTKKNLDSLKLEVHQGKKLTKTHHFSNLTKKFVKNDYFPVSNSMRWLNSIGGWEGYQIWQTLRYAVTYWGSSLYKFQRRNLQCYGVTL